MGPSLFEEVYGIRLYELEGPYIKQYMGRRLFELDGPYVKEYMGPRLFEFGQWIPIPIIVGVATGLLSVEAKG